MESILFLGGLSPAIGMIVGGEPGGEGVRTGENRKELPGGKGNNRGFGEKYRGLEGTKVSLYVVATTLIGGGIVKLRVGKSSEVLGLNHGIISGESGVTMISPSNPREGGEKSI
jgi:hypothetical protein